MAIAQFDMFEQECGCLMFNTKEDWEAHSLSWASYDKAMKKNKGKKRLQRANAEPIKFPCIALVGPTIPSAISPDTVVYVFIYDFKLIG